MSSIVRVCVGFVLIVAAVSAVAAQGRRPTTLAGCPVESTRFYACALEKIKTFQPPRTADGLPDITGFWSRLVTTEDIHDRPEVVGQSAQWSLIVDPPDGKIPYQPWAAAQKETNLKQYISPTAFCDVPGVPRSNFQFNKWQVFVTPQLVMWQSEAAGPVVRRMVRTAGPPHVGSSIKMWLGDSVGRWEGNTLVVDVTNLNGLAWFDAAGDFQSQNIHVVERFALVDKDTMLYVADIEDATVYTRPWRMSFAIPRYTGDDTEIWEAACHEGNKAVEPLLKGGYQRFPGVKR